MSESMNLSDVIPARWKGTITVLLLGITIGGGTATGFYNLGPGATLAAKVDSTSVGFAKVSENVLKLTEMVSKLESRFNAVEEAQGKRMEAMSQISSDVRVQGASAAAFKAGVDERLAAMGRAIERLSEKVDRFSQKP